MLCDDLEGWNGWGGREDQREGIYVCLELIHIVTEQK